MGDLSMNHMTYNEAMEVKVNGENFGLVINDEFKQLVSTLDTLNIDTKEELVKFAESLTPEIQSRIMDIINSQMTMWFGDVSGNSEFVMQTFLSFLS